MAVCTELTFAAAAATLFFLKAIRKELLRVVQEECGDPANTISSVLAVSIAFTHTASQTHNHALFLSCLCFLNSFFFGGDLNALMGAVTAAWMKLGGAARWFSLGCGLASPLVDLRTEYLSLSVSLVHKINRRLLDLLYPQQVFLYRICFCSLFCCIVFFIFVFPVDTEQHR